MFVPVSMDSRFIVFPSFAQVSLALASAWFGAALSGVQYQTEQLAVTMY
jgi:hypothetical protein